MKASLPRTVGSSSSSGRSGPSDEVLDDDGDGDLERRRRPTTVLGGSLGLGLIRRSPDDEDDTSSELIGEGLRDVLTV